MSRSASPASPNEAEPRYLGKMSLTSSRKGATFSVPISFDRGANSVYKAGP